MYFYITFTLCHLKLSRLKRVLVILFSLIYLASAVGFSMDLHRCGKSVKAVSVNASHKTKCPCKKNMPSGCCKDIHLKIKISDSQKNVQHLSFNNVSCDNHLFGTVILSDSEVFTNIRIFDFSLYHAPPFKIKQPVYLTNCIFLI